MTHRPSITEVFDWVIEVLTLSELYMGGFCLAVTVQERWREAVHTRSQSTHVCADNFCTGSDTYPGGFYVPFMSRSTCIWLGDDTSMGYDLV